MVHFNSCTSDINAWIALFREFAGIMGFETDTGEVFTKLFKKAMEGEKDCGGLVSFNYFAGEPVTGLSEGRPMLIRTPDARTRRTFQNGRSRTEPAFRRYPRPGHRNGNRR